jgi:hypothetical protein
MIGTLYRYAHPYDSTRFIYVGQGPNRDREHRSGRSSFGRRFKKKFPDAQFSQPIKEQIDVFDQIQLNEEETIWMFRFHTWHGYLDGMNLVLPGSTDYKVIGKIGGCMAVASGQMERMQNLPQTKAAQRINGGVLARRNIESGHIRSLGLTGAGGRVGGRIQGRKNAENKTGVCGRTFEKMSEDGRKGGRIGGYNQPREAKVKGGRIGGKAVVESGQLLGICAKGGTAASHVRWHIRRGIVNSNCLLCAASRINL